MTTKHSADDLAALLAKATPRPWFVDYVTKTLVLQTGPIGAAICDTDSNIWSKDGCKANAALIVALVNSAARLIAAERVAVAAKAYRMSVMTVGAAILARNHGDSGIEDDTVRNAMLDRLALAETLDAALAAWESATTK